MNASLGSTARIFFALWPAPEVRNALAAIARELQAECGGRATRSDKIHLTLFFVGQVARERLPELERIGDEVQGAAFDLTLDRLGYFRHNRIAWVGGSSTPPLHSVVTQLRDRLIDYTPKVEDRPYVPHITLLRDAPRKPTVTTLSPITWAARDFVLIESVMSASPPRYDVIRRWLLRGAALA